MSKEKVKVWADTYVNLDIAVKSVEEGTGREFTLPYLASLASDLYVKKKIKEDKEDKVTEETYQEFVEALKKTKEYIEEIDAESFALSGAYTTIKTHEKDYTKIAEKGKIEKDSIAGRIIKKVEKDLGEEKAEEIKGYFMKLAKVLYQKYVEAKPIGKEYYGEED